MAVTLNVETLKKRLLVAEVVGRGRLAGIYETASLDDAGWNAKLETAKALVLRYAPAAPDAIHDEAVIRTVSYLFERSATFQDRNQSEVSVSQPAGHLSALRHSGSMALLSPWKVRRGGAV